VSNKNILESIIMEMMKSALDYEKIFTTKARKPPRRKILL